MHHPLEQAIANYHSLIENNLTDAEQQLELLIGQQLDNRVTFGDRPLATSLRPTFMFWDLQV